MRHYMRHFARLLVLLCLLVSAPVAVVPFARPAPQDQNDSKTQTVYVTRTGRSITGTVAGTFQTAGSPCR